MPTKSPSEERSQRTTSRRLVLGGLLVGTLVVGALLGARPGGSGPETALPVAATEERGPVSSPVVADAPPAPTGEVTPGPAPDTRGAVEGFLTAEAAGELATAFTYLAPEEQEVFSTPAAYVAAHADLLGRVQGFAIRDVVADPGAPDRAVVTADVGFVPSLDTVMGLVPARATVTFPTVRSGDGWGISLADAVFEPVLPSDDQAAEDAAAAVRSAISCDAPRSAYGGDLAGQPRLLADLCDADGRVEVATVTALDDPFTVQPFLSAFGPDVGVWARVADVRSPVPLRLVLAPYGDAWTAIGVLPPPT